DLPASRQVEVGIYHPERDALMRQVAISGGPGVNVDAPGRHIDTDRIEGLPTHRVYRRHDVRVAVTEIVVLVDRENAVTKGPAREAVRISEPARIGTAGEADRDQVPRGILDENVIVARRAVIREHRPVGERFSDPDRGRQADRIGDQIAGDQPAVAVEAEEVELPVRELRHDRIADLSGWNT